MTSSTMATITEAMVPVFHRWIQERARPELLIDIADYRHVPDGPGVMLIGHQADYSLDHGNGQWGVRYNRKAVLQGSNRDRLQQSLRSALEACRILEQEERLQGRVRFNGRQIVLTVNDRLLAPNTPEMRAAVRAELEPFIQKLLAGASHEIAFDEEPRKLLTLTVTSQQPRTADQLLTNLA